MAQLLATTKMSSRGQVVIPETIRQQMGLTPGAQFVVIGQNDVVLLKVIEPPSVEDYKDLKRRLRKQARQAGLKPRNVPSAIKRVRGQK